MSEYIAPKARWGGLLVSVDGVDDSAGDESGSIPERKYERAGYRVSATHGAASM
jgi:hypothetical protein